MSGPTAHPAQVGLQEPLVSSNLESSAALGVILGWCGSLGRSCLQGNLVEKNILKAMVEPIRGLLQAAGREQVHV